MSEAFDAIVVGAGIVGLAAAFELAERDRKVCVLEAATVASGATGTSFAWLNATGKTEADYHRLNVEGMARHRAWADRWGDRAAGYRRTGCLSWAEPTTPGAAAELRATFEALEALDYPRRWLDRSELRALEPNIAFGEGAEGFLAPDDTWLDAPQLARVLAGEIAGAGGVVRERCPVASLERAGLAVSGVALADGAVLTAAATVLAAGASVARLATPALGVAPAAVPVGRVPGLLVDLPPGAGTAWVNRVVYGPDEGGWYVRPTAAGGLSMGADDVDEMCGERPDEATTRTGIRMLLERMERFVPRFDADRAFRSATGRVGLRPMPRDGRSIAGPVPGVAGLYVLATHSGVTLAPALGAMLAEEIVEGTVSPLLENFRPDRFARRRARPGRT